MPQSTPVIHRYTPPTCTLEIVARNSPLSRWVGRSVTKLSRFEVRFDDPRLPEEQRVKIQGDRDQLETLQAAVTIYVQDLLNSSPERFNSVFLAQPTSSFDPTASSTAQVLNLSTDDSPASSEEPPSSGSADNSAHLEREEVTPKNQTGTRFREIFLQPGKGLSHDLFLGSLATQETGQVIHLSMLQLFDLATALDQYAADVVALPTLSRPRSSVPAVPAWASIAAVLVLAVGLTTILVQILNRSDSRQQVITSANQGASSNDQQSIPLQPSPTPPLSSLQKLPPLPPVGSTVPSPNSNLPSFSVPGTNPPLPGSPKLNTPPTTSVKPIPRVTPSTPIVIKPSPNQERSVSSPEETNTPSRSGVQNPSSAIASPSPAIPSPSPQITALDPELEAALSGANRAAPPVAEPNIKPTAQPSPNSASQTRSPSTQTTPNQPQATAFDSIPQVAEVRSYFSRNWEPPANLTQTLEYSIVLDVDGTIQRIEPLGQAARTYVDRSGMPLIGESFVSPNKNGQTPRIRVVLSPDGKVQTFLEEIAN